MEKKDKTEGIEAPITNAAQLWKYLTSNGGIDDGYYDREIFRSEDPDLNLYAILGIRPSTGNIEANLSAAGTSVEAFLIGLLKALHPYSLMMADLCAFFEKYGVKYGEENMRIQFDFEEAEQEDVGFDLKSFRELLEDYQKVERNISGYKLTGDQIWNLRGIFSDNSGKLPSDPAVLQWLGAYDRGRGIFNPPHIATPQTGHAELDRLLEEVMQIWKVFAGCCHRYGPSADELKMKVDKDVNFSYQRGEDVLSDLQAVIWVERDFWCGNFLRDIFTTMDDIAALAEQAERDSKYQRLYANLDSFLSGLEKGEFSIEEFADFVQDILSLPVWKRRYELYAAWILSNIDRSFGSSPVSLHHVEGRLTLPFSSKRIATVSIDEHLVELWSEMRSALANPSSAKRVRGIQPDFRMLHSGDSEMPEKHFAAIEVKQHRKSSTKNFREAANDYGAGMVNAEIFLVNYGPVSEGIKLDYPERSHLYGQLKPSSEKLSEFITELAKVLPKKRAALPESLGIEPDQSQLLSETAVKEIFVDVSASLNSGSYREFLKTVLSHYVKTGQLRRITAVDVAVRGEWELPENDAIEQLLLVPFGPSTNFTRLITGDPEEILIITDEEGFGDVSRRMSNANVLVFHNAQNKYFKIRNRVVSQ